MVTFLSATLRATPARKAVRPARAPLDRSRPDNGIFTLCEVMLTILPNRRAAIPSMTRCTSSIGVTMFMVTPASSASRSSSRKSRNGGPPLLFTRMSGAGQAAIRASCPSRVETSAATGITSTPVALRISSAVDSSRARLRALMTTATPASASANAHALPSP